MVGAKLLCLPSASAIYHGTTFPVELRSKKNARLLEQLSQNLIEESLNQGGRGFVFMSLIFKQ